jgi:hypothetical protein
MGGKSSKSGSVSKKLSGRLTAKPGTGYNVNITDRSVRASRGTLKRYQNK